MLEILGPAQWLPLSQTTSEHIDDAIRRGLARREWLCLPQIASSWRAATNWAMLCRMAELLQLIWSILTGLFRSRASREAEIATLRHQLNVLHRQSPKRPTCKYPPAKPGALGCEPLIAAAGALTRPRFSFGRLKAAARRHLRHRFNCSRRASSTSWLRIYSRITSSSRPTVETKYPRAQKC